MQQGEKGQSHISKRAACDGKGGMTGRARPLRDIQNSSAMLDTSTRPASAGAASISHTATSVLYCQVLLCLSIDEGCITKLLAVCKAFMPPSVH